MLFCFCYMYVCRYVMRHLCLCMFVCTCALCIIVFLLVSDFARSGRGGLVPEHSKQTAQGALTPYDLKAQMLPGTPPPRIVLACACRASPAFPSYLNEVDLSDGMPFSDERRDLGGKVGDRFF